MDQATKEYRYKCWAQILMDWKTSGLSKKAYCEQRGIHIKQLYYYQRQIRRFMAEQGEGATNPGSDLSIDPVQDGAMRRSSVPRIVQLDMDNRRERDDGTVNFRVNGIDFTVPEGIPTSFLSKLLEAASHGAR